MEETLVRALHTGRPQIRGRWEALLRIERPTTPLANPDALVHLLDWALDQILAALNSKNPGGRGPALAALRAECVCGRNPFLAFWIAGEQAMLEALVLAQAARRVVDSTTRDTAVSELYLVLRRLRRSELEAFCALCRHRGDRRLPAGQTTQVPVPCNRSR